MKQHQFLIASSLLLGCASDGGAQRTDAGDGITVGLTGAGTAPTSGATDGDPTGGGTGSADGTAGSADDGVPTPKYDVGIESYCQIHGGGIHCTDDNTATPRLYGVCFSGALRVPCGKTMMLRPCAIRSAAPLTILSIARELARSMAMGLVRHKYQPNTGIHVSSRFRTNAG